MEHQIEIYKSADNAIELQVSLDKDTVWLNQAQMASLFMQTKQNVSLHIKNCFKEKELDQKSVVKECLTTAPDSAEIFSVPTNTSQKIRFYQ